MKKIIAILSLTLASSPIVFAKEDPVLAHGKSLHNERCTKCHSDSVYTRQDRQVKTLQALSNQVNGCMKGAAKAQWTPIETSSVIEYLNTNYYKF